jgi:alcohol dehydrogenase (cytochrome c)
MYSRTYDAQRFSPLQQINRQNVKQLQKVWSLELGSGTLESIPIVYHGIIYVILPGAGVRAMDAATGETLWEHRRATGISRAKGLAIYADMVYYTAPDGYLVALDAANGKVRWQVESTGTHTSAPLVVAGKVLTGRACYGGNKECYISAHDALTGAELWRFYSAARTGEPGGDTWGGMPDAERIASTWGLPGTYDPQLGLVYWGVANPSPYTRLERYSGDENAIPTHAPAELFSNSTVALDVESGKMVWYYQHNPGDDWDLDYPHERTLLRTVFDPDPVQVKWINPDIPRGSQRDIAVMVGEGGGIWALDRQDGRFLWATPFPFDVPEFFIADIDVNTGTVHLNTDMIARHPGHHHVICFWNVRSYWPTAYHPGMNALFVPYADNCLDMTSAGPGGQPPERRTGSTRLQDLSEFAGIARINMATGNIDRIYTGLAPGNGAMLATAGDVIFWGDLDQQFRAFDADSGAILWQQQLDGPIQNSTITYAVDGRQYIAVLTGEGIISGLIIEQTGISPNRGYNSINVFALPQAHNPE